MIGKRFQDAGDACVESGVIADGSAAGVLECGSYNRAIQLHKIMFEALNRLKSTTKTRHLVWMSL